MLDMGTHTISRFAPSPTGRMHLGNVFTALMSWLVARSNAGRWLLRIEDLDPQRSRMEHARMIEDDLDWLGLHWDLGGIDARGGVGEESFIQSRRSQFYTEALHRLEAAGLTYPCFCTKADIAAVAAPHASDGRVIYPGTCRPMPGKSFAEPPNRGAAVRLIVPDEEVEFDDKVFGPQRINLAHEWGDFVLRRADGGWAYQLAVVVDDAAMGVTDVVRGYDLLSSCAPQIYLCRLLGYQPPRYTHLPLICNTSGIRLCKRDASLSMEALRQVFSPQQLIGILAHIAGLISSPDPITPAALVEHFSLSQLCNSPKITVDSSMLCRAASASLVSTV